MAERSENFILNRTNTLLQTFELGGSGDDVRVSIYDIDDSNLDIDDVAMTHVAALGNSNSWKYDWVSPNQSNLFHITFFNKTLDVKFFLYARLAGSITGSPTGATEGETLTNLRDDFLIANVDMYNANDLSGTNSMGDKADRCINKGLQKIYGIISDTTWLESNPSTSLASTADQDFIELSGISDLDHIKNITDTTNDLRLTRIPFWRYRELVPDPSNATGVPTNYARLFNRIYLTPRPTSAITYTVDYQKNIANLSSDSDRAGIPVKFNYWILAEAHVFWQTMIDPADRAAIASIRETVADARVQALRDIYANYEGELVSQSQFDRGDGDEFNARWKTPVGS